MLTIALDPHDHRVFVDDTASNMDYFCPTCGAPVIPRRGEVRRHHFAHKGGGTCTDGWARSYDDSEWHHLWQERFPRENQEVTLTLGEVRHRADILVGRTVVEFQKSALSPEQFNDRNTFYQDLGYKVVWLFDLRDEFREGSLREVSEECKERDGAGKRRGATGLSFSWKNPRKAFRKYDLERGNVDVFLQLRDAEWDANERVDEGAGDIGADAVRVGGKGADDGPSSSDGKKGCIVRPINVSPTGFERFEARRWMSAEDFLHYVGMQPDAGVSAGMSTSTNVGADGGVQHGTCPPPDMTPLEPNGDYLRFKRRYGIELSRQQERAAQTVDGATLLLAVPGSGKTTVLVARLGYLTLERGVDPESIVCITYTRAAAEEMRSRFTRRFERPDVAEKITFCTINKLAKDIYEKSCQRHGATPRRIDSKATRAILRDAYRQARHDYATEGDLVDLETEISRLKNTMHHNDDDAIASIERGGDQGAEKGIKQFGKIFSAYQENLESRGLMDFDDQILFAFNALGAGTAGGGALRQAYHDRFRYWCVDEAQDTSRLQHNLIYRLAGQDDNVFMVGDEDQSIFGYRGAYPKAMLNFRYVYRNAFVLKIERNYRSGKEIVSAARRFIGRNEGRIEKSMVANRESAGIVRVLPAASRSAQWQAVFELARTHEGELAILYRNNDTAIPLVDRLLRDGVPFTMRQGKRTFFDCAEVRDVRAFLDLAGNPHDVEAFRRIYYKAGCFLKKKDAEWAVRRAQKGRSGADGPDILDTLVDQMSSYRKHWQVERDTENAEEFATLIRGLAKARPAEALALLAQSGYADYLREKGHSTTKLDILRDLASREETTEGLFARLDQLDKFFASPGSGTDGSITLSSVHSAKGLEFDTVVIMDAVDGTFPSTEPDAHDRSKDSAATYQEERRLFYVAMTRAKDELVLVRPKGVRTSFVDEVLPRKRAAGRAAGRTMGRSSSTVAPPATTAPPTTDTPLATPARRPRNPRYDVDTWDVMEVLPDGRSVVTNGDMDAMVSPLWGRVTVEMVVDLEPETVAEVAEHIDELSWGADTFALCLSACAQQTEGNVRVSPHGDDDVRGDGGVAIEVDPALAPCLDAAANLMAHGITLTMTVRDSDSKVIGREVERVDLPSLTIALSEKTLPIY